MYEKIIAPAIFFFSAVWYCLTDGTVYRWLSNIIRFTRQLKLCKNISPKTHKRRKSTYNKVILYIKTRLKDATALVYNRQHLNYLQQGI